jgi:hypothetical protein
MVGIQKMRVTPPFGKMRFIPHKLINLNSGYERYTVLAQTER